MRKTICIRQNRGFTLAELLVVIAIVGILVAVSIPVFSGKLDKARAATCEANRRALKAEISSDYMSGAMFGEGDMTNGTLRNEHGKNFDFDEFCPEGGTITAKFDGTSVTVYCSVHRSKASFGDGGITMDSIISELHKQNVDLDSGAVAVADSHTMAALRELKALGIDIDGLGAASWRYKRSDSKGFFYWSTVDINKSSAEKVPTMRYNANTGTYTIWIATIGTGSIDQNGPKYKTLGGDSGSGFSAYEPSTRDDKLQTYESAMKLYEQALKEYKLN